MGACCAHFFFGYRISTLQNTDFIAPAVKDRVGIGLAFLFAAALIAGTFFQGNNGELLVVTQCLLLTCATLVLWQGHGRGLAVPGTALAVFVLLYWLWLIATVAWSPVPAVSVYLVWWIGSLPFAFWLVTLTPEHESFWQYGSVLVLTAAAALALSGVYQFFVLGERPSVMFYNVNSYAGLLALIAVPTAAHWLIAMSHPRRRSIVAVLGIALFVLVYTIGLTQGRGALLGLLLGLSVLAVVTGKMLQGRLLFILAAMIASALVLANVSWHGGVLTRVETLASPATASVERLMIWRGSWEMLQNAPWRGIGLGIYSLAWPPYRNPADTSAGFFVHDDYLQIWIEAGLPGLFLFLGLLLAGAWLCVRLLRSKSASPMSKIEAAGLASGVFAIAFHSLFDFNFYVVPTLLIVGASLARIQFLATAAGLYRVWRIEPKRFMTAQGYRIILVLLFMFPLVYFATLSLSAYETRQAVRLANEGKFAEADAALAKATTLYPYADSALMSRADLYRHAIALLPAASVKERTQLFDLASKMLDRAEQLNPLRVQTLLVRALLYRENPTLAGPDWQSRTRAIYEQVLRFNPRLFEGRLAYADFLVASGDSAEAHKVLEDGLRYYHADRPIMIPYYVLTAKVRRQYGDSAGATDLEQKVRDLARSLERNREASRQDGSAEMPLRRTRSGSMS